MISGYVVVGFCFMDFLFVSHSFSALIISVIVLDACVFLCCTSFVRYTLFVSDIHLNFFLTDVLRIMA